MRNVEVYIQLARVLVIACIVVCVSCNANVKCRDCGSNIFLDCIAKWQAICISCPVLLMFRQRPWLLYVSHESVKIHFGSPK